MPLRQGKTSKRLRILLTDDMGHRTDLGRLSDRIRGRALTRGMLRLRFCDARESVAIEAHESGNDSLSERIRQFQFRDARAKAASEITNLVAASQLLAHTEQEITEKVYRRIGQKVMPPR